MSDITQYALAPMATYLNDLGRDLIYLYEKNLMAMKLLLHYFGQSSMKKRATDLARSMNIWRKPKVNLDNTKVC